MFLKQIKKFIKKIRKKKINQRRIPWPTKEEIEAMKPFEAVDLSRIVVVAHPEGAQRAFDALAKEDVVGFDTESKPVFQKGKTSDGPHVAQFSTHRKTYIFILKNGVARRLAASLIALKSLKKVGFGLGDDLKRIRAKLKVNAASTEDVELLFAKKGYGRGVGVKVGVAIALKRKFRKSKRASTSNWAHPHLKESQLIYAANDAFAALKVYQALKK